MRVAELRAYLEKEIADAKANDIMLSLHLKVQSRKRKYRVRPTTSCSGATSRYEDRVGMSGWVWEWECGCGCGAVWSWV